MQYPKVTFRFNTLEYIVGKRKTCSLITVHLLENLKIIKVCVCGTFVSYLNNILNVPCVVSVFSKHQPIIPNLLFHSLFCLHHLHKRFLFSFWCILETQALHALSQGCIPRKYEPRMSQTAVKKENGVLRSCIKQIKG